MTGRSAARFLAMQPGFARLSHDQRLRLARRFMPDLDRWSLVHLVVEAEAIEQLELRPARERAIAREAARLLGSGATKLETARRCGVSTAVLDRILQTNAEGTTGGPAPWWDEEGAPFGVVLDAQAAVQRFLDRYGLAGVGAFVSVCRSHPDTYAELLAQLEREPRDDP